MKKLLMLISFLTITQVNSHAQSFNGSFEFESRIRNYEVYLPQNYKPNLPLVFAIHGYTQSISNMKNLSKMHEITYTSGFIRTGINYQLLNHRRKL